MDVIPTGIPKLDDVLNGGIEEGSSLLLLSVPGIDANVFAHQILFENLKAKSKAIYFIDNKLPSAVLDAIKKMTWKFDVFKAMSFIDCFSCSIGFPSKEKYAVKKYMDAKELDETITTALKENSGAVAVFDSLSSLLSKGKEEDVIKEASKWVGAAKKNKVTSVFLFTNWDFSDATVSKISKQFDYVVSLKSVEEKVLLRNYFSVEKAPKKFLKTSIPFRIGMEGVAIYIPKIVVTGPFHAGKSSFIHAVSTKAVSVDRMGTTIALDHGYIDYGGLAVDLFGTPGQERFEFMMDILNRDAFGLILVVDSTDPSSFERGKEMAKHVMRYAIPYVIAANKQDLPGALSPEEVRKKMELPAEVPVLSTVAPKKKGCIEAVQKLIDMIVAGESSEKPKKGSKEGKHA